MVRKICGMSIEDYGNEIKQLVIIISKRNLNL